MVQRLPTPWSNFIDSQHREPHGLIGRLIGERMLRQHKPETNWSIDLLELQSTDRVLEIGFGAGRGLALATRQAASGLVTGAVEKLCWRRPQIQSNEEVIELLRAENAKLRAENTELQLELVEKRKRAKKRPVSVVQ